MGWEYRVRSVPIEDYQDYEPSTGAPIGEPEPLPQHVERRLGDWAADGWELQSDHLLPMGNLWVFILKRPTS